MVAGPADGFAGTCPVVPPDVTAFEQSARATASYLEVLGLPYALVGGFAVSVWCEPRFTRDIDLVVAVSSDEVAEGAVRALAQEGYEVLATAEHDVARRLATVRLAFGPERDLVDLLFASSGIEPEIAGAAPRIEVLPGLVLPVAAVGHLIALKLLATDSRTRPQDQLDLRALVAVADPADLAVAGKAVAAIEARGYQRGRDLVGALAALLSAR